MAITNHLNTALAAVGLRNPSYSNASASQEAEASRLQHSANRTWDGMPHNISEPPKKFWARNLGAMAGHTIHQAFAAGLTRVAGEYAGLTAAEAAHKNPAGLAVAQAAVLVIDLARVGFMMVKARDPATKDSANIAFAGAADLTAGGRPTDASAAQKSRIGSTAAYGMMLLATDVAGLGMTIAAAVTHSDTCKQYAGQIAKFQLRNAVFATGRDFMQTVGSMVGGGGDNLTFHHTQAPRGAYFAEQVGAGMLMDVASAKLDKNTQRFAHAAARAAINTVPEILDWFALTQKASNINARHEGLQNGETLQHFSPSLNQHLRNGDLKKFALEVGHKLTDQSVVRNGALDLTLATGHALEWAQGTHMSGLKQSGLNNTLLALLITAFYPRVNAIWQAQGDQRASLVAAAGKKSNVVITELEPDIEAGPSAAMSRANSFSHLEIDSSRLSTAGVMNMPHAHLEDLKGKFIEKETVTGLKSGRIASTRVDAWKLAETKLAEHQASTSGEGTSSASPTRSQSARFEGEMAPKAEAHLRRDSQSERFLGKKLETILSMNKSLSPESDKASLLNTSSRRSDTKVGGYASDEDAIVPMSPLQEGTPKTDKA